MNLDLYVLNHNTKVMRNFNAQYAKTLIDENAGDRLYENLMENYRCNLTFE